MRAHTHTIRVNRTTLPLPPYPPCTTLHYRNTSLLMSAKPDQPIHPFPWVKEHAGNKREQADWLKHEHSSTTRSTLMAAP